MLILFKFFRGFSILDVDKPEFHASLVDYRFTHKMCNDNANLFFKYLVTQP